MRSELIKIAAIFSSLALPGCTERDNSPQTTFRLLSSEHTNIRFENTLTFSKDFNIYTYRNFYNGGGVAIGDINNDSLPDIFFTANMADNRLYLNKGNMVFEDITARSKIVKKASWSTGVSMADVNGDGLLDIYVCNSGDVKGGRRQNELYINNGNLTFTEKAEEYRLADKGFSTHAAFFDYDRDGDLDMYLLNNSFRAIGTFDLRKNERNKRDTLGGHKLFRNDSGYFSDVSEEAGIYGSVIGFGLGVSVSDLNKDGWPDIYVSNDFFERDYLYVNNRNGGFDEQLELNISSISNASMGADIADINNDSYPDIFTTEMLPLEETRLKNNTSFESWDKYKSAVQNGYHHQFTRNALQLNNTDGTFSEIGRLAGVEASDWSWGALINDFDNDGNKDIFVANGILQDLTNQDYIQYISNQEFAKYIVNKDEVDFERLISLIPSTPIPNCLFANTGSLRFAEAAGEWGLSDPAFSNGAAYGDLDNDGDADLVVNNLNMASFVYENRSRQQQNANTYVRLILQGDEKNRFAVGATATLYAGTDRYYQEAIPARGFQSTVDNRLLFGTGKHSVIDSIIVHWPDGSFSVRRNVNTNSEVIIKTTERQKVVRVNKEHIATMFEKSPDNFGARFIHTGTRYMDFDRERLLFHNHSETGPAMDTGDVNGDGRTDFYVCGTTDDGGALFIQTADGTFTKTNIAAGFNESDCELFDADGDGDLDLYIATGGNAAVPNAPFLRDLLYKNNGEGKFIPAYEGLPEGLLESNSCVASADYDNDGDIDLFVGSRFNVLKYGYPARGSLLQNDGSGKFTDVTAKVAPVLLRAGMITDAVWIDISGDEHPELLLAGEFMPLRMFEYEDGVFLEQEKAAGLEKSNGWWTKIAAADLNNDGLTDIIALNHGLNSRFRASEARPVSMYVADFDNNGTVEQVLATYNGNSQFPVALRHDLLSVLPMLKKKFLKYADFAGRTVNDVMPHDGQLPLQLEAYEMRSCVFINTGKGSFNKLPLPPEAQFSSMYAVSAGDYDRDSIVDLVLGGNVFNSKPETGIYDASQGLVLKGKGDGTFSVVPASVSGFAMKGEIRDIIELSRKKMRTMVISRSGGDLQVYTY